VVPGSSKPPEERAMQAWIFIQVAYGLLHDSRYTLHVSARWKPKFGENHPPYRKLKKKERNALE